jgi:glutaredoxin-like protein
MAMFTDNDKKQLRDILSKIKDEVELVMFAQELECETCAETRRFAESFTELSDKLKLTVYNFVNDKEKAEELGVDKIPALVILDKEGTDIGIRFYGIPAGYEINSLTHAIIEVSGEREELPAELMERIKKIDKEVHIQVFIGLTCPYCPTAVVIAHRLALENEKIRADMIEASTFPHLLVKYNVMGVPKVVINETAELVGAQPIEAFLEAIEKL